MFFVYECRKQINLFILLITIILFVLNTGMTAYIYRDEFGVEKKEAARTRQRLVDLYNNDRAGYENIYDDYLSRLSDYNALLYSSYTDSRVRVVFENKLIDHPGYGDRQLFSALEKTLGTAERYKNHIASLLRDAAARIKEDGSRDGYTYRYYIKLIGYYDNFAGSDIGNAETAGWNEFFALQTPVIFIVLASLAAVCGVFTADSRDGMTNILRVSKRGGRPVTASKLCYTAAVSVFISVSFTLSTLIVFTLSCGLSSPGRPVQTLDAFTFCRYELSIWQYLIIYTLVRTLVFLFFSLAAAVLGQYTRSEIPAFIFTAALAGIGAALSGINPVSKYYFLQKFSALEIANVNILFTRFRGLNIFGKCADYSVFILFALALLTAAVTVGSFIQSPRRSAVIRKDKKKSGAVLPQEAKPLLLSESYKHIVCGGGMYIALAALLLKCMLSVFYYRPVQSVDETLYIRYIEQYKGEATAEKFEAAANEKSYIENAISVFAGAENAYRRGDMTADEFKEYKSRRDYAEYYQNACNRLYERSNYLAELAGSHENIEFVYEEGIKRLLFSSPDTAALLAAIFICGNVFAVEYESGFFRIMRILKKGRSRTFNVKIAFSMLSAMCEYAAFSSVDLFFVAKYYHIDYLSANILSMPQFAFVNADMSILAYIILYKALSLAGYIACFIFITSLSVLLESKVKTMTASALILFIPFAADYFGVTALRFISFPYFIAPADISRGIVTCLFCSLSTAAALLSARVKWNGNRAHNIFIEHTTH